MCLILTSFFVPICVHMTRADYEWPFRKPLIWYDEFLRVTWERINGGNSMEMHLHPVFIHWKVKCHCFCWRFCLFFAFLYSLGGNKLVLIEFLELQTHENKLMNILREAKYSICYIIYFWRWILLVSRTIWYCPISMGNQYTSNRRRFILIQQRD